MIRYVVIYCTFVLLLLSGQLLYATPYYIPEVRIDSTDTDAIKRGAGVFFSVCAACHSIKFMRYQRISDDLALSENNLRTLGYLPDNKKLADTILTNLSAESALSAYGIIPPDLSLKAREKGTAWIHAFLTNYYQDASTKTGFNNAILPGTSMPNLLVGKQGILEPVYNSIDTTEQKLTGLQQKIPGSMSTKAFYNEMRDLVTFLDYVGEPSKRERYALAPWVFLFLFGLLILVYLLKNDYWRDVD